VIGGFARRLAKLKDPLCKIMLRTLSKGDRWTRNQRIVEVFCAKKVQLSETKINEVIKEVEKLIPELIGAKILGLVSD